MNQNDLKRLKINEWKTGINKGGRGGDQLTPARGGSAHQLVSSWVPKEIPPLARAFALFLLGSGHDCDEEEDEDGAICGLARRGTSALVIR